MLGRRERLSLGDGPADGQDGARETEAGRVSGWKDRPPGWEVGGPGLRGSGAMEGINLVLGVLLVTCHEQLGSLVPEGPFLAAASCPQT